MREMENGSLPRQTAEQARPSGQRAQQALSPGVEWQAEHGKTVRLLRTARGGTIRAEVADTFLQRFRGLMLRRSLPADGGLLIAPCASIHMCFMRFAIDAVYLDASYRILKIVPHLLPWLGLSCCRGAWGCLELPAGAAARLRLAVGERLAEDA